MTDGREALARLVLLLLFGSLLFSLMTQVNDPDFWWHLSSGRWMAENGTLLNHDPFSMQFDFPESAFFRNFVLRQYWLAQLIFYGVYSAAGFKGIIVLCACTYTLMFLFLYLLMRQAEVGRLPALLFVYVASVIVVSEFGYTGARPQMWSSLFTVLIVYFLEKLRQNRRWTSFAVPLLMVLWSNLHGGYIFGDVIIALYILGAILSRTGGRTFYSVAAAALLLSGLNPNGYSALLVGIPFAGPLLAFLHLASQQHLENILDAVTETQSLFQHARLAGIVQSVPFFSGLVVLSLASFIVNFRRIGMMRKEHILLYVIVLAMGLRSIRFIVFFVTIASLFTAVNFKDFFESSPLSRFRPSGKALFAVTIAAALLISAGYARGGIGSNGLFGRPATEDFEGAATFVQENRLEGNLFNDYNAGGYLIWRLYPGVRVFVDGRNLYKTAFDMFRTVVDDPEVIPQGLAVPAYKAVLDRYSINLVMIPGCDKVSGTLINLAAVLLEDRDWTLIYADDNVLLFMRTLFLSEQLPRGQTVPKERAYEQILATAVAAQQGHARMMPNWEFAAATGYEGLGNHAEAARWVDAYLRSVPADPYAARLKKKIESAGR